MDHIRTDEEIAKSVQDGDTDAFGILMERYEAKLLRYGKRFLSYNEDIADLVQDVFIKTYENILSYDANLPFSPWIYRIAHNEFVNALKKKSRSKISFVDFDVFFPHPVASISTDEETDRREMKELIEHGLSRLDVKYREPLVLYYIEELSYEEISDILRIPVSTVGVRLKRAKDKLRNIISERI